jgi:putative flippase GtrA
MFDWKSEFAILVRYCGSGVVNTVIGFTVIFGLMALGVGPFSSNVLGYAAGLCAGFYLARRFVFYSDGDLFSQGWRYIAAFAGSYAVNLLVLYVCTTQLAIGKYLSQVLASGTYLGLMYPLSRWIVFAHRS